jgi:hypothetical protein
MAFFSSLLLSPMWSRSCRLACQPCSVSRSFSSHGRLTYGRRIPWLPAILTERSFAREDLARGLDRVLPRLESVERFLRPRWQWLVGWNGERLIGFTCLVLCIVLALPIPLGNILPALTISILGIAIVEKDGVVASIGYVAAVVSLVVVAAMLIALVQAFLFFLSHALS